MTRVDTNSAKYNSKWKDVLILYVGLITLFYTLDFGIIVVFLTKKEQKITTG